jgi:3-oxoacyl-[acyl-carrier-protein] synthase-3
MNIKHPVKIVGVGSYLPPNRVSSESLETKLGMPAGWSMQRSGVRERRYATTESNASMGARAIEQALERAELQARDLDLLICGSATFDYPLPNQASVTKSEMKGGYEAHFQAIDVDATCLSFVTAFDLAAQIMEGKRYRRVALVSSEIASLGLNPADWETSSLFGDGAAAVILEYDPAGEHGVIQAHMRTYSEGVNQTIVKGGGTRYFFKDHPYDPALHSFQMEGKKLLRMAKKRIPEFMDEFFAELGIGLTDVELVIPHQASKVGVHIFRSLYPLVDEQVYNNLEMHGNLISVSIPLALCQAIEDGTLQRGQTCMITGTSAGFAIGGVLFRY